MSDKIEYVEHGEYLLIVAYSTVTNTERCNTDMGVQFLEETEILINNITAIDEDGQEVEVELDINIIKQKIYERESF